MILLILQAKWKSCSQQGLLAQAQCHTNCSDTASGSELTQDMGRRNPWLPGEDPADVTTVYRNQQLHVLLLYGCVSVVFPHLPCASSLSHFVVCPSIHFRVRPCFTFPSFLFWFSEVAEPGTYRNITNLSLSLHNVCLLNLFMSVACQLLRLWVVFPAQ